METYGWPHFIFVEEYPEGDRVQFGGGYEFTAEPKDPDQVTYVLNYAGMFLYPNAANNGLSLATSPNLNFGKLRKFYQDHRMWKSFLFLHPWEGVLKEVKFKDPLVTPKGVPGGRGLLEPFSVKLRLQP
jgi:hypothetical protein